MKYEPDDSPIIDSDGIDKPRKNLKTVVLEFEDGTIECLEGDQAKAWLASMDKQVFNSWIHGGRMVESDWKEISREHAASLFMKEG